MRTVLELVQMPALRTEQKPCGNVSQVFHGLEYRREQAQQTVCNWTGGTWRFVLQCNTCGQLTEYHPARPPEPNDPEPCACSRPSADNLYPDIVDHWCFDEEPKEEEPPVTGAVVFDEHEEAPK